MGDTNKRLSLFYLRRSTHQVSSSYCFSRLPSTAILEPRSNRGAQVIAPLFVIVRVATQRAVTNDMITSGNVSSICFGGQETSTSGSAVLSSGSPVGSMAHEHGGAPNALGVGGEIIIKEILL